MGDYPSDLRRERVVPAGFELADGLGWSNGFHMAFRCATLIFTLSEPSVSYQ